MLKENANSHTKCLKNNVEINKPTDKNNTNILKNDLIESFKLFDKMKSN